MALNKKRGFRIIRIGCWGFLIMVMLEYTPKVLIICLDCLTVHWSLEARL